MCDIAGYQVRGLLWVRGLNRSRGRPLRLEHTHVIHKPRSLPVVLSVEQVARLSSAA